MSMEKNYYDPDGQKKRGKEVRRLVCSYGESHFDDQGNYFEKYLDGQQLPTRERVWYCIALLESDDSRIIKKANAILRKTGPSFGGSFGMVGAIQLLKYFKSKLDEDNIQALEKDMYNHCTAMLSPQIAYSGINDNFPSMDCSICLIGGEMLGNKPGYEKGIKLLHQLKDMLTRRGFTSEYTSPTYSIISLQAMADIAEHCTDPAVKELALSLEQRLYIDILGHYHPLISGMTPPHSRAYMVDNCGNTHQAKYVYHILFGDKMPLKLTDTLLSGPNGAPGEVIHSGLDYMFSECASHSCTIYHLPAALAALALNKSFPFEIAGTTESRARRDIIKRTQNFIYPGSSSKVYTYMEKNYAVGTTTKEFSTGDQTNSFGILYRKGEVKSQADVGTVFSRYIFNEADPNKKNKLGGDYPDPDQQDFMDFGRKLCMQKKNTAVAAYRPKHWAAFGVTSLKLSLILPANYRVPEKILLGKTPVDMSGEDGVKAESVEPCTVIVKDGPVYMGFKPLSLTDHGRKAAVKVEKLGNFVLLSFYNYEGEKKIIDYNEAMMTANGILCEVRQQGEIAGTDEMQALLDSAEILDEKLWYDGFDTDRHLNIKTPSASFECTWCPETESVKYMLVDGEIPETPILSVPGLQLKDIPLYTPSWEKIRNL